MAAERTSIVRADGPLRARVLAGAAALLLLIGAGVAFLATDAPPRDEVAAPPQVAHAPEPVAPFVDPRDDLRRAASPAAAQVAQEPQEVTVDQLPRGDGTGIDAFPRPGTKPLQVGLVVPDGYELPPGFVRHYQTTDEGVQLPPILKFHPDHVPEGAPADRVVPPEMAPRDMPRKWLELPPERKKQ